MIQIIQKKMKQEQLSALIISDPDSVYYATGVHIFPHERLMALIVLEDSAYFIAPKMHAQDTASLADRHDLSTILFQDDEPYLSLIPSTLQRHHAIRIGVDKTFAAKFLLPCIDMLPEATFINGSYVIDHLRMVKTKEEQEKMRHSSRLNDDTMRQIVAWLSDPAQLGVTEIEATKKILSIEENLGTEGPSFDPLVCFGANNCSEPHHSPDQTKLAVGMCVIIDIGCIKNGYCSDMTRSFIRTEHGMEITPPAYKAYYDIVREANQKAIRMIKPGVPLKDIDAAARNHIIEKGYGEYFVHRTGHGIGITVHEFPDVSSVSDAICQEGMIFSVEPGIYIPGEIGIRVEDLLLVTKDGVEELNHHPK